MIKTILNEYECNFPLEEVAFCVVLQHLNECTIKLFIDF